MRKALWLLTLAVIWSGPGGADVLTLPENPDAPRPTRPLPDKGATMAEVEKKYGEPRTRHPTVGGGAPLQPPITRWDYEDFTVIFEKDRVVDAVIPGAPPRLRTREGLRPAPTAMTPEESLEDDPALDPLDVPETPSEARAGPVSSAPGPEPEDDPAP